MASGKLSWVPVAVVGAGFVIAALIAMSGGGALAGTAIAVAAAVGGYLLYGLGKAGWDVYQEYREEFRKRAQRNRQEVAGLRKQRLVTDLGTDYAALVGSANAAVKRVVASEAARAGWLGDADFSADIAGITDSLRKAHELRKVSEQLAKLDRPSADDQKILADAQKATASLAATAISRVELIKKCAEEAELVDRSLRQERQDAQTAEQRAELHAKLSSILYGIEAVPSTSLSDSAADSVIARVQAYREIKNQIQLSQD